MIAKLLPYKDERKLIQIRYSKKLMKRCMRIANNLTGEKIASKKKRMNFKNPGKVGFFSNDKLVTHKK